MKKTARVLIGHVFGTKNTVYAEVLYRGQRLYFRMENENPQRMCDAARQWAHENGFTHCKVLYGGA